MRGDGPTIGFLGTGFIAMIHGLMLDQSPMPYRMGPVFDVDPDRAKRFASDFGGTAVTDPDDVLTADAVFICTWTSEHRELVRRCAEASVAMFCEKPLGVDLADAQAVADLAATSAAPTMVGLVLRSSPAMLAARELIRGACSPEGIGQVISVVFRDDQYLPTQGQYGSTWRGDPERAGSGVLLEHSIHDLDIIEWLVGPVSSVSALGTNVAGIVGIEDSVAATFRLATGGTVSLTSVWHQVLSRPSQRHIEIFAERAMIAIEGDLDGPVVFTGPEPDAVPVSLSGEDLMTWLADRDVDTRSAETWFLAALSVAADAVPTGPLDPSFDEALRAHVVADATYASMAAQGAVVPVPRMG